MKRIALVAALLLVALLPATAKGAVFEYNGSCTQAWNYSGNVVPFICLAEDTNYSGDKLIVTFSSDIADLGLIAHTAGGSGDLCNSSAPVFAHDSWNDCISSFWGKLGKDDSFCLYRSSSFRDIEIRLKGPTTSGTVWTVGKTELSQSYGANDVASSIMLQQSDPSC